MESIGRADVKIMCGILYKFFDETGNTFANNFISELDQNYDSLDDFAKNAPRGIAVLPDYIAEKITNFFDSEGISVDPSDVVEAIQDTMYYLPELIGEVRKMATNESAINKNEIWRGERFRSNLGASIRLDCAAMQEAVTIIWEQYCPNYPLLPFYDEEAFNKAYEIYSVLTEQDVPRNQREHLIFEMLNAFPVDANLYRYAYIVLPRRREEILLLAAEWGIDAEDVAYDANDNDEEGINEKDAQLSMMLRIGYIDKIVSELLGFSFARIQSDPHFNRKFAGLRFITCGSMCPVHFQGEINAFLAECPGYNSKTEFELFAWIYNTAKTLVTTEAIYTHDPSISIVQNIQRIPLAEITEINLKKAMVFQYIYINEKYPLAYIGDKEFRKMLCNDLRDEVIPYLKNRGWE